MRTPRTLFVLLAGLALLACAERVDLDALVFACDDDAACRAGRICDLELRVCVPAPAPGDVAEAPRDVAAASDLDGDPPADADAEGSELSAEVLGDADGAEGVEADAADGGLDAGPCFEGAPCDDGDPCTSLDRCKDGVCVGTPVVGEQEETCELGLVDEDCDGLINEDPFEAAGALFPGASDVAWSVSTSAPGWLHLSESEVGLLGTPGDVDWYRIEVASFDPFTAIDLKVGGFVAVTPLEICVLASCDFGGVPAATCEPSDAAYGGSEEAVAGCCHVIEGSGFFEASARFACPDAPGITAYARLSSPVASCDGYRVSVRARALDE
jgi:hypothetical protein